MADRFSQDEVFLGHPFVDGAAITANDSVTFTQTTRGLYVGSTGNVHVKLAGYEGNNTEVTFVNVQAGTTLSIRAEKVFATDTDAADLIGLY